MVENYKQAYVKFLDNEIKSSQIRLANTLCKHTEVKKEEALNIIEDIYEILDKELEKTVSEYDFFDFSESYKHGK